MSKEKTVNLAASIHQRLLNISREEKEDPNHVLIRYGIERFLYRLSRSGLANHFVLKGAMLFSVWTERKYRPTKDVDFSGYGEGLEQRLESMIQQICQTQVEPDGLEFDANSVQVHEIREDQEYQGQRVHLTAKLRKARIGLQIDVGFGDAMTPGTEEIQYPAMLDLPAARIRACSRETVVAEKLQAMVALGMANSRMKDFYDLWIMANEFSFDGAILAQAIKATFDRRKTEISTQPPSALTEEFSDDPDKQKQWKAFLQVHKIDAISLISVIEKLREFLLPPMKAVRDQVHFVGNWSPARSTAWKNR